MAKSKEAVKKPNIFIRAGRKIKEVFSELKKVTWPTFPKILKGTVIVIVVVVIFTVAVSAIDAGLGQILKLLSNIS